MSEDVKAYIVDPEKMPDQKSKDKLKVEFMHYGRLMPGINRDVWFYRVHNLTKQEKGIAHISELKIWRNGSGDFVVICNCPARVLCKHIIETASVHKKAIDTGFIKEPDA